jgi:hypothetical protein
MPSRGGWIGGLKLFREWLNKGGIKLPFTLLSIKPRTTRVHLFAPTTYAKQDKQLCDSKIYTSNTKAITSSDIEIIEARGDDDILPSFSQHGVRLALERGGIKPPTPQKTSLIVLRISPQQDRSTLPLSVHLSVAIRNLSQGWGTSSQLNWRLPTNKLGESSTT